MSNPNHPTLISSPGARGLLGILPKMSIDEALDVTRIYSLADQLPSETPLPLLTAPAPRNAGIPAPSTLRVLRGYFAWANSQTVGRLQLWSL
jgi:hypothetical protein